jgi:MFS family permease
MLPAWLLPPALNRNFHRLFAASAFTNLGDGVLLSAGPLLIASYTDSPAAVGAAVFVQQLPWLLFGLLSGALVDRLDGRRLIVAVNICRALTMAALGAAVAADSANIALIYLALFVLGTGETPADTASSRLLVSTVAPEHLGTANARLGLTFTAGNQLAGPPLGALLFSVGHAVPSFTQAITFAAGAVLVSRLTLPSITSDQPAQPRSVLAELGVGLRWLRHHPAMRTLVLSILVMNVAFSAPFATWVLYCRSLLGLSNVQFGLLTTCAALGGLAGPWAFGKVQARFGHATIVGVGFVIEAAVHLVLATVPPTPIVALIMVGFGIHTMVWGAAASTLRQRVTPHELLGRVSSVYFVASIGGSALGAAIGSAIAQHFSLTTAFWAAGVVMLIVAVIARPALRNLEPSSGTERAAR